MSRWIIPYSWKFLRDPIFVEGQSAKISQSKFHGWMFQNACHGSNQPKSL